MKKRILGILITLVMLIGLVTVMSVSASAATTYSVGLYNLGGYQYEGGSSIAQYQVDKSSASEGDTVTIYMRSLNTGWIVDTVTVTNKSTEQEVAVTDIGSNKYTFTMPASDVSVRVKCVRAPLDVISNTTENGTYTVPAKVSPKTTATIYANPASGYSVDTVTVTGNTSGNSVDVSYIGNNSYAFKMPEEPVTVTVTFGDPKYHVWVGGTQITAANASNVFGDGTVKFTPASGSTAATLTLNGYTFNNGTIDTDAVIFTEYEDLTILLAGENSITTDKEGINAINCALTIADDTSDSDIGKLYITAEDAGIYCSKGDSSGILNIEGVELNIESTSWAGIYTYEADACIKSATITIKAKSDALYVRGADYFGITDSTVNFEGDEIGIDLSYTNEMVIMDSNVSAAGDQAIYAFGTEICIYSSVLEATGTNNAIALSSDTGVVYFYVNSAHYVLAGNSKDTADYVNPTNLKNYSKKYVKIVNRDPKNLSVTREGVTEYFDSLENVWDYLEDGDVIKVEHDYIETYADVYTEFYDSISYTIDLNGNEIHFPEDGSWQDAYWTDVGYFQPSGILTLTDSVGGGFMHAMVDARYADSLAVTGGTYVALFAPTDTKLSGGTFTGMPQEAVDAMMEDPYQAQFAKMIGTKGVLHNSFSDDDINSDEEAAVAAFNKIFADNYVGNKGYGVYETQSGYYLVYLPANSTILEAYNVTLNYGVGDEETNLAFVFDFTEPVPRRISGKIFIGWYDDAELTALHDFSTGLTKDITLYAKYADYEDDKEALNNNIDAAKAELQGKIDAVESALASKADAATLVQAITDLNTSKTNIQTLLEQIDDYEDADTALKTELITKIETADNLINTAISDLTSRVETLESELAAAKSDVSTNASEVAQLTADLATINASLTDLSNKLTNDYATKAELTNAINSAKDTINSTIDALTIRVQNLEAGLAEANGKININTTDVGTLKTDVSDLKTWKDNAQDAIEALQTLTATQGTNISALQTAVADLQTAVNTANDKITAAENRIAALEDKVSALETAKQELEDAVSALQTAVATKADAATVNAAIAELQTAINALETAKNNYVGADDALRTELEGKIANAQTAAISAAEALVNNAKAELQSKIDAKADAATTTAAIQNLQAAVSALEAVKDDYANADATLKAELEGKIATAKVEAIYIANKALTTAKNELSQAIALKADTATLNAKVNALNIAIANAESVAKAYADTQDAALKAELQTAIANAKSEAIGAAQLLVDNAKAELQTAIDTKADTATVNAAIANLQNAITALEAAKDNYVSADAALKSELEAAIERAKKEAIEASKGYIPHIGANGNWWIGDTDTGVDANGIKGDTGAAGADGVGIAKIEKTSSDGNVDTYTITLTNGTTYTFTVTNGTDGKDGTNGTNGVDGKDGTDGEDGQTPYIGENGNWWIGDTDTGVKAAGDDGKDGGIIIATTVGGTALISNIALIAWALIKKKRLF